MTPIYLHRPGGIPLSEPEIEGMVPRTLLIIQVDGVAPATVSSRHGGPRIMGEVIGWIPAGHPGNQAGRSMLLGAARVANAVNGPAVAETLDTDTSTREDL